MTDKEKRFFKSIFWACGIVWVFQVIFFVIPNIPDAMWVDIKGILTTVALFIISLCGETYFFV